ncbi:MAG: UDP-3-O-(3-hydroxymyristoyl)glucosamine N-acyltransferase [candidate division NC10 bacterium]|nr:UDP-3-O-(3-hydroxymyristoyl)glucosamine N-acyltransferase [candidate division NC10 bacterium]
MKLSDLADALSCQLQGEGGIEIKGVAGLREAEEGDLTFVANPRYLKHLEETRASAIILSFSDPPSTRPTLRTENPYLAFAKALRILHPPALPSPGIHPSACLEEGVRLGEGVSIGALTFVGRGAEIGEGSILFPQVHVGRGSRIGKGCLLYPQVMIREGVCIGDRVIIHSGAVLGSDGFGYAKDQEGHYHKIPQIGGVLIEDEVEIGANVTIDRATLGQTRIGRGTKIDNLVQIAHNVEIGQDTILIAQVGIAGSTKLGNRVTLAGQVGLIGHLEIGDDCVVGSQSGVVEDLKPGSVVTGSPAIPHPLFRRMVVSLPRVPEMLKTLRDLKKRLEELEKGTSAQPAGSREQE